MKELSNLVIIIKVIKVEYKKTSWNKLTYDIFIDDLNKKNHFKGFPFECYVQDIINAFDKFGYQSKSKLFEQFFLESIQKAKP